MTNDSPLRRPARKVNVTRGMFRAWVLFSAIWFVAWIGLASPTWYIAASYRIQTYGFKVKEAADTTFSECNIVDSDNKTINECFDVTSPAGCRYFVVADRHVYTPIDVAAYVAESEKCAPPLPDWEKGTATVVELTSSVGQGWVPRPGLVAKASSYPDLSDAKVFTILAFAVPAGLLALGTAFGWVATGFKP